eukprot:1375787-Rhodomonas_salina.1
MNYFDTIGDWIFDDDSKFRAITLAACRGMARRSYLTVASVHNGICTELHYYYDGTPGTTQQPTVRRQLQLPGLLGCKQHCYEPLWVDERHFSCSNRAPGQGGERSRAHI